MRVVDFDRDLDFQRQARVDAQSCVRLAFASQDEHDGPIGSTENAIERCFVRRAGKRAIAGMSMDPDSREAVRVPAFIDLAIEKVGDGGVVHSDMSPRACLQYKLDVLDKERIVVSRDAESADFGLAQVT